MTSSRPSEKYDLVQKLSRGAFSTIYLARRKGQRPMPDISPASRAVVSTQPVQRLISSTATPTKRQNNTAGPVIVQSTRASAKRITAEPDDKSGLGLVAIKVIKKKFADDSDGAESIQSDGSESAVGRRDLNLDHRRSSGDSASSHGYVPPPELPDDYDEFDVQKLAKNKSNSSGASALLRKSFHSKKAILNVMGKGKIHLVKSLEESLIEAEVRAVKRLCDTKAPFVIELFDVFELSAEVWLVTELAELGDLGSFAAATIDNFENNGMSSELILWFITPIILAMAHMHSNGMIHRDIKDANIVLTLDGVPKLCDFGTVHFFDPKDKMPISSTHGYAGTPAYAPPEMLKYLLLESEEYIVFDTTFDIWSLGMTMVALRNGGQPLIPGSNIRASAIVEEPHVLLTYLALKFQRAVEKSRTKAYKKVHEEIFCLGDHKNETEKKWDTEVKELAKACIVVRDERPTAKHLLGVPVVWGLTDIWKQFSKEDQRKMRMISSGKKLDIEKVQKQLYTKLGQGYLQDMFIRCCFDVCKLVRKYWSQRHIGSFAGEEELGLF